MNAECWKTLPVAAAHSEQQGACSGFSGRMWRGGIKHHRECISRPRGFGHQFHHHRRSTSSAPTFINPESFHEHLSHFHALRVSSSRSSLCSKSVSFEQSLSTLDAALSSVVQIPLFSNPFLSLDGESLRRIEHKFSFAPKALATAVEVDDPVEAPPASSPENESSPTFEAEKVLKAARAKARKLYLRQEKMELDAWDMAVQEYKKTMALMCRKKLAPNLPFAKSLMLSWFEPVRDAIAEELRAIEEGEPGEDRSHYGPFLRGSGLSPEVLTLVTMHRLMGLMMQDIETGCVRLANTSISIGDSVEQEISIRRALTRKKKGDDEAEVEKKQRKLKWAMKHQNKKAVKNVLKDMDPSKPWPSYIQAKVGCRLIEIMLSNTHIEVPVSDNPEDGTELRPAFRHILKIPKGGLLRSFGAIVCDKHLIGRIDDSAKYIVMPYSPMLIPPRPWKGYNNGAYLHLRSLVMRTHGSKQQREAVRNTPKAQLKHVFRALDTLGATCWKINKGVLDVMEQVWNEGGRLAKLVDRNNVPLPPRPENPTPEELLAWRKVYYKSKATNAERHSQRCDLELKLSVARKLRDEEGFYYPHNLDFRGRAYPMHAHLNHLGSDVCRGILEFANGRPLGKSGFHWLKVHVANVYANGADKLPFHGRLAFTEEHLEDIIDSANHPLEGRRWWLQAEDPFQCLAACIEVRNAVASPNHEDYVSCLPIHQDGSCNGLQHYAALSRDKTGAEAVNLIGGEAPADVYSGIAARVRERVAEDAAKDPATCNNAVYARHLMGHVDRKLVKQTVMTSVYGVTFVGARNQITNRLREKACIVDEATLYRTGCYAAKVTLNALGEMFKEARCIMNWLGDCAKVICADGEAVRWVTPLGLPVVQPYRRPGRHVVKTTLQSLILRTDTDQPVMAKRQRSAFPPNFVHSMDGSHMMMTAVACHEEGLAFAGVHDSFWTHAGDVERMNVILREKFVELYEQPILENLLESFKQRWPKLNFPSLPERGDLNVRDVLESPYFFN